MTSHSLAVRVKTVRWGSAIVILVATLSCNSMGTEPKPAPVPAVPKDPEVPATPTNPDVPATPNEPRVPEGPLVPVTRGQIVFLDPWEKAIFVADSSGRRLQRVSQTSGAVDLAVSADGTNIAFSRSCESSSPPCSHMYIMSVNATEPLLLETGDPGEWPGEPTWSPDGKRIAFVQGRIGPRGSDSRHIYTINADGTGMTQLTHSGYHAWPEWSPDGRRILFVRSDDSDLTNIQHGIFEMDPDGSNVRELTPSFRPQHPTWSPDGSLIAFVSVSAQDYRKSLSVMNANGSDARILKSVLDYNERPAWSPDGKSITFIVSSAERMCDDIWDFGSVPCGQSAKRIGLDGLIDPTWGLPSASNVVWQR